MVNFVFDYYRSEEKRRHGVTEPPIIRIRGDSTEDGAEEGYLSDSSSSSTDSEAYMDANSDTISTSGGGNMCLNPLYVHRMNGNVKCTTKYDTIAMKKFKLTCMYAKHLST